MFNNYFFIFIIVLLIWTFALNVTHSSSKENILFLTEIVKKHFKSTTSSPFTTFWFFFTHYHQKLKLTHILGQASHTHTHTVKFFYIFFRVWSMKFINTINIENCYIIKLQISIEPTSNEDILQFIPPWSGSLNLQINVLRTKTPIQSPYITKNKSL